MADDPAGNARHDPGPRIPHVIAITSGKGGVGKSSIAVNLGIVLARMGRKVCIFDADTGLANINILLGVTPRLRLEHALFGNQSISEVMIEGPHGLQIIPGANGITECADLQPRQQMQLTRDLAEIESQFDYLLLDTAAGISDTTLDLVRSSRQTLLVITPEPTSLTDAFSMLKLLKRRGKSSHFMVVVNMCSSSKEAQAVFSRFSAAVQTYIGIKVASLGFIMQDESLRAAVTMQSPVALFPENDPSCKMFFRLGHELEKLLSTEKPVASFSAFWRSRYEQKTQPLDPSENKEPKVVESAPTHKDKVHPAPATPPPAELPFANSTRLAGSRPRDVLSELRTRLLTLIAQGEVPVRDINNLVNALNNAARRLSERNEEKQVILEPGQPETTATIPAELPAAAVADPVAQCFDATRFGSQQQLLQYLRQHNELPVSQALQKLDQGPGERIRETQKS